MQLDRQTELWLELNSRNHAIYPGVDSKDKPADGYVLDAAPGEVLHLA